jgi:hypothetical protein
VSSKVTEAPYDEKGNLLEYPTEWIKGGVTWKKIAPFKTTLWIEGMERGRSAARFIWKDEKGHAYPMFMRDMLDVVKTATILSGGVSDTWVVRKSGSNYGVALAGIVRKRKATSWRSEITCRKCGRKGVNGFRYIVIKAGSWTTPRQWHETEYLKDDKGQLLQECEATAACAKRQGPAAAWREKHIG